MRWKTTAALLAALLTAGCASYTQLYVDAYGRMESCSATGVGVVGAAAASMATSACGQALRSAGFVEIERAGVIGLLVAEAPDSLGLRVLSVAVGGPAARAGVVPGEHLVSVGGVRVESRAQALPLAFGLAGESVSFELAERETSLVLVRDPFPSVYGREADPVRPEDGQKKSTTTWSGGPDHD